MTDVHWCQCAALICCGRDKLLPCVLCFGRNNSLESRAVATVLSSEGLLD